MLTREGAEDGGWLMMADDGAALRAWSVSLGIDLDAPNRRGRAYRFSPSRVAQRVLLAKGERVGLLTDGEELRLLICDPARPDSHIAIRLDRSDGWRAARRVPDSYRLLLALASPAGVAAVPELTEQARLAQATVTKKLRLQARRAVESFIQELLDHPANAEARAAWTDPDAMAHQLWSEGLVLIYRLLFIFKLESSPDPARAFSFAATSLWRNTYSPNVALAPHVRCVLDEGADTGGMLEAGLRTLFRMFVGGLSSSELQVSALGGMLFGEGTTPLLDGLAWGERAVASLLDALLWTPASKKGRAKTERERVHYGSLDVEDLGRVYEALLELEPGIAAEPMCRLRRAKLEVVVPEAQGEPYRAEADRKKGGKTKVEWIEAIPPGRFYLRVGLGRKASGSYYTPHPFVRFLVQETLGPQLDERSPRDDPHPGRILDLKVLDPAMGSGHFLVEACRYLGEALYEACRLCDELAVQAEDKAGKTNDESERQRLLDRAAELRRRVEDLPDPDDELVAYLPSRVPEGEESGLSQRKAEALCRRLVAVHCLHGVDKNPLAVELAKLSLWLESYAEGLPLTFMDHRLVCGDSLTGPFFEHLLAHPKSGESLDDLFAQRLTERLEETLAAALVHVRDLEASVGKDVADLEHKRAAKERLDAALEPLKLLATAWSGGVMLGERCDDAGYQALAKAIAAGGDANAVLAAHPRLREMVEVGREGVAFELAFPEVFYPHGTGERRGFDAVVGNPPWDALQPLAKEFFAAFDLRVLDAPTRRERAEVERRLEADPEIKAEHARYVGEFDAAKAILARLMTHVGQQAGGQSSGAVTDVWQAFAERGAMLLGPGGRVGYVLPSAFHANQSATGIRRLYLEKMALQCCFSFENRNKLFDIHRSFKFAAVVAKSDPAGTADFDCAFYLQDLQWLFDPGREVLRYSLDFVRRTGGEYLSLLELRSRRDAQVARRCFELANPFGDVSEEACVVLGRELHMTDDAHRFTATEALLPPGADPRDPDVAEDLRARGYLPLHEGKTFHQYDDRWGERPRYCVAVDALADKPAWLGAAQYYRLAFRDIASSTNERTGIFCLLPPGVVCGNTAPCEREPESRPLQKALMLMAVANAHPFDWPLRQKAAAHVNLFILNGCPFPRLDARRERYLAHAALRLTCNHAGYAPLWTEQLGDAWREPGPRHTWPVLEGDDERWAMRAAIDAVVAEAYGLSREQYEHVLSSFSHRSYPKAPELCLAAFDELKATGLEAFSRKHDPYWDVPLNESLPEPVIDLPIVGEAKPARSALGPLFDVAEAAPATAEPTVEPAELEPEAPPVEAPQPAWMRRTPIDRQVLILSRVVDAHQRAGRIQVLGNVKAEKIVHLVEAHVGIDLEREPVREAAGPADFPRLKKVAHRAAMLHAFSVQERAGGVGGVWSAGGGLRKRLGEYEQTFAEVREEIDGVIDLFVPMDSQQAEIVATLYACWNDLLVRGQQPSDDAIIEAFYGWHESKGAFDRERLEKALAWMRDKKLVPTGRAKATVAPGEARPKKPQRRRLKASTDDATYKTIVSLLDERGLITSRDAQQATGLDASGVRPFLRRLVDEGLAITEGQRRGTKYRRAPDA